LNLAISLVETFNLDIISTLLEVEMVSNNTKAYDYEIFLA